jgi:hypothetical protein
VQRNLESLVPNIITLHGDTEPAVARAARSSLWKLTGEDFGPSERATKKERAAAIAKWKAWWRKQSKEQAGSIKDARGLWPEAKRKIG